MTNNVVYVTDSHSVTGVLFSLSSAASQLHRHRIQLQLCASRARRMVANAYLELLLY